MGALSMGLPGALYGAARAVQDIGAERRTEEGFQADQAIRRQQLQENQDLAPLRRHSLEIGVLSQQNALDTQNKLAPLQIGTAELNLDLNKLSLDQQKEFNADAKEARANQRKLRLGLANFQASQDPQSVADTLGEIYPEFKGTKATRNEDGSITVVGSKGQPHTFSPKKSDDGTTIPADGVFSMWAYENLDPVKIMENKYANQAAIGKEAAKQSAIESRQTNVQEVKNKGALDVANARATKETERRRTAEGKVFDKYLLESLKTQQIPGGFAATYSNEDDAKLLSHMRAEGAKDMRENDTQPEEAVRKVIDKTRSHFATAKKAAIDSAKALMAKGIDPKDPKIMAQLYQQKDPDAVNLLSALGTIKSTYGEDISKYALDQLPSKKR